MPSHMGGSRPAGPHSGTDAGATVPTAGADSGKPAPRWLACLIIAALAVWGVQALLLGLHKQLSIDEFGYAHMAWLLAKGSVPYRDFFDAHPPLFPLLLSVAFRWGGDDPHRILYLRGLMVLPLAASLWAAARLSRPAGNLAMLLAPLFMLASPGYILWAVEIRPDAFAFALFLCAAALLDVHFLSRRFRFALIGVLAGAACWTTIKALVYVAVSAVLGATCYLAKRRSGHRPLLVPLLWFLAGFILLSAGPLAYLAKTGTLALAWKYCVTWSAQQQAGVPSFPWSRYFDPAMRDHVWIVALALLGLALEAIKSRRDQELPAGRVFLILALVPAFLSHAIQRTAYAYNLIPWIGLLAVWASAGMAWLLRAAAPWPVRLTSLGFCATLLIHGEMLLIDQRGESNTRQREALSQIERQTAPSDCVYDNAGSAVTRPHAHYHFYTDAYVRRALARKLVAEVPPALVSQRCVMRVLDMRSEDLPEPLRAFLRAHYQPVSDDLAIWGQRYRLDDPQGAAFEFLAVESGEYFTFPTVPLSMDDKPILTPSFRLEAGRHRLRYEGALKEFFVLWLPRDRRPWVPLPRGAPTRPRVF